MSIVCTTSGAVGHVVRKGADAEDCRLGNLLLWHLKTRFPVLSPIGGGLSAYQLPFSERL